MRKMGLKVSALVLFLSLTFVFGVNAAGDKFEGFEDAEFVRGDIPSFTYEINK